MKKVRMATMAATMLAATMCVAQQAEQIVLMRGERRRVDFADVVRQVSSSNPDVARVDLVQGDNGKAIMVSGVNYGEADITATLQTGERTIRLVKVQSDILLLNRDLDRQLGQIIGINIELTRNDTLIDVNGTIKSASDWEEYKGVVDSLPAADKARVRFRVQYKPAIPMEMLEGVVTNTLGAREAKVSEVKVDGKPAVEVQAKVYEEGAKSALMAKVLSVLESAELGGTVPVIDKITIETSNIEIECIFYDISVEQAKRLGIDLLNNVGLTFDAIIEDGHKIAGTPWAVTGKANLDEVFKFLVENGGAQVISRQTITTSHGEQGMITSGGEVTIRPQPYEGGGTSSSITVPYGFAITATPYFVQGKRTIKLVVPEFKADDVKAYNSGVGDVEVKGTKGATTVYVEEGRQKILTNYDRQYTTRHKSGVPVLRSIPWLGRLFSREEISFIHRRAGFIVIVRAIGADDGEPIFPAFQDCTKEALAEIKEKLAENRTALGIK